MVQSGSNNSISVLEPQEEEIRVSFINYYGGVDIKWDHWILSIIAMGIELLYVGLCD